MGCSLQNKAKTVEEIRIIYSEIEDTNEPIWIHKDDVEAMLNTFQIDKLYRQLRELVADRFAIIICDKSHLGFPKIAIKPISQDHPWTHFQGKTMVDALERAIKKLENPHEDYVSLDGHVWKATESSIYDEVHTRGFLRNSRTGDE